MLNLINLLRVGCMVTTFIICAQIIYCITQACTFAQQRVQTAYEHV